jgi:uncharacterized protein YraI
VFAGLVVVGLAVAAAQFQSALSTPSATPSAGTQEIDLKTSTFVATAPFQAPSPAAPSPTAPSEISSALQGVDLETITAALPTIVATATTRINVRSGPGLQFGIVGAVAANAPMSVTGCLEASRWCSVDAGGLQGWAYSQYLASDLTGTRLIVGDHKAALGIRVVTFTEPVSGQRGPAPAQTEKSPIELLRDFTHWHL